MLLYELNAIKLLGRVLRVFRIPNNDVGIYCFLSPTARYGVYISRTEVPTFRPLETHFYDYHFTVSDFILDTVTEYESTCGPFKVLF